MLLHVALNVCTAPILCSFRRTHPTVANGGPFTFDIYGQEPASVGQAYGCLAMFPDRLELVYTPNVWYANVQKFSGRTSDACSREERADRLGRLGCRTCSVNEWPRNGAAMSCKERKKEAADTRGVEISVAAAIMIAPAARRAASIFPPPHRLIVIPTVQQKRSFRERILLIFGGSARTRRILTPNRVARAPRGCGRRSRRTEKRSSIGRSATHGGGETEQNGGAPRSSFSVAVRRSSGDGISFNPGRRSWPATVPNRRGTRTT